MPTVGPKEFAGNAVSSSSISVSWEKPNKAVLHGDLKGYVIEYRRVQCNESDAVAVKDEAWVKMNVTGSSDTSALIGNLTYWSCYGLKIAAVTVGVGSYSDEISIRTLENGWLTVFRKCLLFKKDCRILSAVRCLFSVFKVYICPLCLVCCFLMVVTSCIG